MAKLSLSLILFTSLFLICGCASKKISKKRLKPNVVIIFLDDSGYSDFSPFKDSENITPNVSELAKEGTVYQNFHVPQAICTASRAALLTGCYPGKTRMFGALAPTERGLDPKYATLAEQLKKGGYATGWFGKWHLGDMPETRPDNRGFDETAGLMYSNDMWKHNPVDPDKWGKWPLHYWKNGKVIIDDVDSSQQKMLTKWSTDYSLNFVENHKDEPFFLYLAYSMPHTPIFCSDAFEGKSGKGLYGDVIMELDHGIGLLMDKLKEYKLDKNTIVVFSSDNGPWSVFGNHAGKTPFRESKATSFDGGIRTQLIVKYPGVIPSNNESNTFIYSIDLFPTICELTGSPLPESKINGENVLPRLTDAPNNEYKRDYHPFSNNKQFEGVFSRDGRWKLILPHGYGHVKEYGTDGVRGTFEPRKIGLTLYDMENDPYETTDVQEKYPDIFKELKGYADLHKAKFYAE